MEGLIYPRGLITGIKKFVSKRAISVSINIGFIYLIVFD